MISVNEGGFDRAVRMVVGIQLMALGFSGAVAGTPGIILIALGALALITGTAGWCPLYSWFGWSTVPKHEGTGG
jgi:hypothetical protein